MIMKKKYFVIILLFLVTVIISIFYSVQKRTQAEKLKSLYDDQNRAFLIECNHEERMRYQSADKSDLPELVVFLYVYNAVQDDYNLNIEEVLEYLCEEYNSNNNLNVYFRPDAINDYIKWFPKSEEVVNDFRGHFIDYMKETGQGKYWELSYEEVTEALEKYKNAPSYVPPKQDN